MKRFARDWPSLVWAYLRFNLRSQASYRTAFLIQVVAMIFNDALWVSFWVFFFGKFQILNGWTLTDFITMWALVASGFGLAHVVGGNGLVLASIISSGQLDAWLLQPRSVLPHVLLGRTSAGAVGDVVFGVGAYLLVVRPDPIRLALFVVLLMSTALFFLAFSVLASSLAFFVGHATALAEQWMFATITFSLYPPTLFEGMSRVVLFTAIPAAVASYLPNEALRSLDWRDAALAVVASVAFSAMACAVFRAGLRRYESGNVIMMRG